MAGGQQEQLVAGVGKPPAHWEKLHIHKPAWLESSRCWRKTPASWWNMGRHVCSRGLTGGTYAAKCAMVIRVLNDHVNSAGSASAKLRYY